MSDINAKSLFAELAELSSAEDFFLHLLVPYDPAIVRVCRLHIMKRMGVYLRAADIDGMTAEQGVLEARLALKRAYEDFRSSTPLEQKVFKVFTDKARETAGRFVSLGDLSLAAE